MVVSNGIANLLYNRAAYINPDRRSKGAGGVVENSTISLTGTNAATCSRG